MQSSGLMLAISFFPTIWLASSTSQSTSSSSTAAAIAPLAVRVLGFEEERIGSRSEGGWFVSSPGWKAELTDEKSAAGKRAAKLSKPGESSASFGNLMRKLPGEEFAGKHVALTAKICVAGEGRAQMWLRADRGDTFGAFDNMDDRPIRGEDWHDATIEADIEVDATALNVGFMSTDDATIFIDEVKLEVSAARSPLQKPTPPRELSARELANLAAASKLLAYVRFFHPSDAAVGMDSWDHFAVELLERAEPATDAADLVHRLSEEVAPIAPTVELWAGAIDRAPKMQPVPSEATHFVRWQHVGVGLGGPRARKGAYSSTVEKLPRESAASSPETNVVVKSLGAGVSCRVPIAIAADDTGTLPHAKTPEKWAQTDGRLKLTAANRSTRFADVALAWGVFQHFYPYFDVVHTDWDAALTAALAKAATDKDDIEFLDTLREMVAKLHDGHGGVYNMKLHPRSNLPLAIQWVGKDLVITGKPNDARDLDIGDVIVSIDGRPIEECYATVAKQISAATDGWSRYESQGALLASLPTQDPARLVVRKLDGREASVELARTHDQPPSDAKWKRPANGSELAPGIVYFDLNAAKTEALDQAMPKLADAKAIVFDMRGYPGSAGYDLMQHLIDAPSTSARWCFPVSTRPDHEGVEWHESGRWQLEPKSPRLTGKIAFLTDGRAISYAESVMGIVENYKMGEIVGSTTAGTNGNVNPFTLPGGYEISWTGMKVLKHDGSQHHGVGIAPTVPVIPTAKGIAEGRDEVLEKAIEVLKASLAPEPKPAK